MKEGQKMEIRNSDTETKKDSKMKNRQNRTKKSGRNSHNKYNLCESAKEERKNMYKKTRKNSI